MYYLDDSHKISLTFPAWAVECWQELSHTGGLSSSLSSDILNSGFYSLVCCRAPGLRTCRNSSGCWETAGLDVSNAVLSSAPWTCAAGSILLRAQGELLSEPRPFLHVCLYMSFSIILCRHLPFYIGWATGNAGNHTGQKQKDTRGIV